VRIRRIIIWGLLALAFTIAMYIGLRRGFTLFGQPLR